MVEDLDPSLLTIRCLGDRKITSPLERLMAEGAPGHEFYTDDHRVLVQHELPDVSRMIAEGKEFPCFEVAGPRKKIFFDPAQTNCAVVTCGGLCPGLNDVIRAIVMQAHYRYGVRRIYGIPYGFEGLIPDYGHGIVNLTPDVVANIHEFGGTWT